MHLTPCLSSSILLVLLLHLLLQAILLETVTVWHSKPGIFRAEAAEAAELLRHFIAQRHPPVQEGCCTLKDEAEPHKKVAIAGLARIYLKTVLMSKTDSSTKWHHMNPLHMIYDRSKCNIFISFGTAVRPYSEKGVWSCWHPHNFAEL